MASSEDETAINHVNTQQHASTRLSENQHSLFKMDESRVSHQFERNEQDATPRSMLTFEELNCAFESTASTPKSDSSVFYSISPYEINYGLGVRDTSSDNPLYQPPVALDRPRDQIEIGTGPNEKAVQQPLEASASERVLEEELLRGDQSTQISRPRTFPQHEHLWQNATVETTNHLDFRASLVSPKRPIEWTTENCSYDAESINSQSDDGTLSSDDLFFADENPPNPKYDDDLGQLLEKLKPVLIQSLMSQVLDVLNENWAQGQTLCAGNITSSKNAPRKTETSTPKHKNTQNGGHTIDWQQQENDNDDFSDDDNGKAPKRPNQKQLPVDKFPERLALACPFRKHDPSKYSLQEYQSCAVGHWESVGRVKEHIYRRHRAPIYCVICWMQFERHEQLTSHLRGDERCEKRPGQAPDGITPEVEKLLRIRKKEYKGQTEPELWNRIYRILFPNEIIPSPCFEAMRDGDIDAQDRAEYNAYYRRELPRLIWSRLEPVAIIGLQSLVSVSQEHLHKVIEESVEELSNSYKPSHRNSNSDASVAEVSGEPAVLATAFYEPSGSGLEEQDVLSGNRSSLGTDYAEPPPFGTIGAEPESAFSKVTTDTDVLPQSVEVRPSAASHSMEMSWTQGLSASSDCYCTHVNNCTHTRMRSDPQQALPFRETPPNQQPSRIREGDVDIESSGTDGDSQGGAFRWEDWCYGDF